MATSFASKLSLWHRRVTNECANTRFHDTLRLLNKLRPGSIPRVDAHEDGILRRSNVTKFLALCSTDGLPAEDLFLPNDLVEGTPHSLARVARTIDALVTCAAV